MTTSYGYNLATDLLTTESVGGTVMQTIGYTSDGRMSSFSPGIQAPGGQYITSLSYNQDARLSAVNAGSEALAAYTYDGLGQRLIKTVGGTAAAIYQYGPDGMLLEETDGSGVAQADYIYLDGRPIAVAHGKGLDYLVDDMLSTPQLAVNSGPTIEWQAAYEPFGTGPVSGTITQNLRLPGQYFDLESGWNHNGFRDYLPSLGRYAEPDPLGRLDLIGSTGAGTNPYAYVRNNPVSLTDRLGLCPSRDCIIGALEEVIKDGEGTNGKNGYGELVNGTVTSAPSQFSNLVGQTGTTANPIVLDPDSLSGFPNIAVSVNGTVSHAYGAYQFMPGTWTQYGGGSDVSPSAQDDVAATALQRLGAVDAAASGNIQDAIWDLNTTWASLPDSPYGQPTLAWPEAMAIYAAAQAYLPECR